MTNFENTLLPVSYNLYKREIEQHITLSEIIMHIASNQSLDLKISAIRNERNPQNQKQLKNNLPLFFPAIELPKFKRIDDNQRIKSTGLIHFDIDIYEEEQTEVIFEQLISKVPYLLYAFRSPRNGLKFSIASDLEINAIDTIRPFYTLVYHQIKVFLQSIIPSLTFDNANERVSQSCFFSFDPCLYVNYSPEIFLTKDMITSYSKQRELTFTRQSPVENPDKKKQKALEALSFIPTNLHYHERFKINLAVISVFGSEAQGILLNHWQHENHNKLINDIKTQVSYALNHPIMISAGTLFYYAKQYGFNF